jgi:cell division protein ZapE
VQTVLHAADHTPEALGAATTQLHALFLQTVADEGGDPAAVAPQVVPVMFGRTLEVSAAAAGVAWLTFDEICAGAVGSPDFVAVASNFHTVFVAGVPQLSLDRRYVRPPSLRGSLHHQV